MTAVSITTELRRLLLANRNPDGGWGYYAGKKSRLEPSCWAALALSPHDAALPAEPRPGFFRVCAEWRQGDRDLLAEPGMPANLSFNGLACLALKALAPGGSESLAEHIARGLASTAGVSLPQSPAQRQDNGLRGWPWVEGTFSWVEPTSWCLLAMKRLRREKTDAVATKRIDEAERLLADRRCSRGGWNYGNSNVFGQQLNSYVPTTAIALLALQDHGNEAAVRDGVEYLRSGWSQEKSCMALALTLICFTVFGIGRGDVEQALMGLVRSSGCLGNQAVMGMVLYALLAGEHGPGAFAL